MESSTVLDRLKREKLSEQIEDSDMFYEQPDLQPLHSTKGTHLSTCGHVMHLECFEEYRKKAKDRVGNLKGVKSSIYWWQLSWIIIYDIS